MNGDWQMASDGADRVHVHTYNGDQAFSADKPVLVAPPLAVGFDYMDVAGPSKLRVRSCGEASGEVEGPGLG